MFNFLKKKTIELNAPIIGEAVELNKVPDEVFASKMLGDGLAFNPREGTLYAPINGEILQVFPTKHAIGMKTKEGLEILLHIGVDTVELKGEGFKSFIEAGNKVKVGQKLIEFDIPTIKSKAKSDITPLIITNMELVDSLEFNYGATSKDTAVLKVNLK